MQGGELLHQRLAVDRVRDGLPHPDVLEGFGAVEQAEERNAQLLPAEDPEPGVLADPLQLLGG
jgi:hypothetical protein